MTEEFTVSVKSRPDPDQLAELKQRLTEATSARQPEPENRKELSIFITDSNNTLIAGLYGHSHYDWFYIKYLWVDKAYQGQGIGRRLLAGAEKEAKRRHCLGIHINTYSFQAPDFYRKLGYTIFGELDNYPKEHSRIWLQKRLA